MSEKTTCPFCGSILVKNGNMLSCSNTVQRCFVNLGHFPILLLHARSRKARAWDRLWDYVWANIYDLNYGNEMAQLLEHFWNEEESDHE